MALNGNFKLVLFFSPIAPSVGKASEVKIRSFLEIKKLPFVFHSSEYSKLNLRPCCNFCSEPWFSVETNSPWKNHTLNFSTQMSLSDCFWKQELSKGRRKEVESRLELWDSCRGTCWGQAGPDSGWGGHHPLPTRVPSTSLSRTVTTPLGHCSLWTVSEGL